MTMKGGLSTVLLLGGIWIGVAPFWLGFASSHGAIWTGAVTISVSMGALIVVAGLVGLLGFASGALGEAERQLERLASEPSVPARENEQTSGLQEPVEREEPEAEPFDTDEKLQALVDRVLKDHTLAFEAEKRT